MSFGRLVKKWGILRETLNQHSTYPQRELAGTQIHMAWKEKSNKVHQVQNHYKQEQNYVGVHKQQEYRSCALKSNSVSPVEFPTFLRDVRMTSLLEF